MRNKTLIGLRVLCVLIAVAFYSKEDFSKMWIALTVFWAFTGIQDLLHIKEEKSRGNLLFNIVFTSAAVIILGLMLVNEIF
ncbi:hypothetical protein [Pseudalkalibacillus decolorationis]|uniref:hypothetical protein n=1 Tax=Pseudalkalibacillus decolorationis TaxID=163879 RepID=UPI002148AA41|nr:hypothetical protein [Pseudalkalibacillus decolorationis]